MRTLRGYLPLLSLLFACAPFAAAQSSFDLNFGLGSAHDGSNGGGIDNTTGLGCAPGSTSTCQATSSLSGVFLGFGGDVLLQKHYGFGGEVSFNPAKQDYGPFQYRETFYDFNGIYAPVNEKKVQLKLMGGIGGARTGFSIVQSQCIGASNACTSYSTPYLNANHFQLHVGVGVEIFVTEHVFVRPQFDFHYVPGLTDEFSSTSVPAGMVWVGYSWGDR